MAKTLDKFTKHIMDCNIWTYLLESLKEDEENNKHGFWTDGGEILCKTEAAAEAVASFLDDCGFSGDLATGYYDPEEDKRNGEEDCHTGYYYIRNIFY